MCISTFKLAMWAKAMLEVQAISNTANQQEWKVMQSRVHAFSRHILCHFAYVIALDINLLLLKIS
jgi:hypothetical protein